LLVPVYGFLAGDTLGLLVLMQDHETVAELAQRLTRAASPRIATRLPAQVFHRGRRLDPQLTIAAAGLVALDRVDVTSEGA
jgi:toluene monooxygenase system protein B